MAHLTQVKFAELTGKQLVAEYNAMAAKLGRPVVKKFEDKRTAVARCEALQAILTDRPTAEMVADEPRKSIAIAPTKKAAKVKTVVRHALRDDRAIRTLGPFVGREGTDRQAHFLKMGGCTVAQYLGKFPEEKRKTARHWLYNLVKDGLVEVK